MIMFLQQEGFMTDTPKHLNDENFESTIAKGVTLVDFYADWCGPCKRIAPLIEELATEMKGKVTIGKLDVEGAQRTTANFQVMSIPTLIVFKDGKEIKRLVGLTDKKGLVNLINSAL